MKKAVIILSGGMDSGVLLAASCPNYKELHSLTFDYGSKHNHCEIPMAIELARKYNSPHKVIKLDFLGSILSSSLLTTGESIPDGNYNEVNMASTIVPFRNGIMLAIAVAYAENIGASEVLIGAHGGDHPVYPDCRPGFIDAISRAAMEGTTNEVKVLAPYATKTKLEIANIGRTNGFDFTLTWTCYKGKKKHCGTCAACNERKQALEFSAGKDPTSYEL